MNNIAVNTSFKQDAVASFVNVASPKDKWQRRQSGIKSREHFSHILYFSENSYEVSAIFIVVFLRRPQH